MLTASSWMSEMHVQLFDAAGKLIHTQTLNGLNTLIHFSSFANGLYLLQMADDDGVVHYQTKITHAY